MELYVALLHIKDKSHLTFPFIWYLEPFTSFLHWEQLSWRYSRLWYVIVPSLKKKNSLKDQLLSEADFEDYERLQSFGSHNLNRFISLSNQTQDLNPSNVSCCAPASD